MTNSRIRAFVALLACLSLANGCRSMSSADRNPASEPGQLPGGLEYKILPQYGAGPPDRVTGDCPIIIRPQQAGAPDIDVAFDWTPATSTEAWVELQPAHANVVLLNAFTDDTFSQGGGWELSDAVVYDVRIATDGAADPKVTIRNRGTGEERLLGDWKANTVPYDALGVDVQYAAPGTSKQVDLWIHFQKGSQKLEFVTQ